VNIVFFGTSVFAAKILAALLHHKANVVAIVTRTDKPQGRSLKIGPPPVKELALAAAPHVHLLQPIKSSTPEFAAHLQTFDPDLFIVAAYGEILKQFILDIPTLGAINVHASLLPKYRGAAPIQRCLMHGDAETGITLMKMVLEMDAGDIVATAKIPLTIDTTFGELEDQLADLSCPVLFDALKKLHQGTLHSTPQNHALATYAPKLASHETEINWDRPAFDVHNQIRALAPFPGAWCYVETAGQKKKLKIKQSRLLQDPQGYPGENLLFSDKEWIVGCKTGSIALVEVQLEGKKSLPIAEFLRGQHEPCRIEF
jgi:methionyl-tRNA formyltransferase